MAASTSPDFSAAFGVPQIDPTAWLKAFKIKKSPDSNYASYLGKAPSKEDQEESRPTPGVDTNVFGQPVPPEDLSHYNRAAFDAALYTDMLERSYDLANRQSVESMRTMFPYQVAAGQIGRVQNRIQSELFREAMERLPSALSARASEAQGRRMSAAQEAATQAYATAAQQQAANQFGTLSLPRYGA